MYVSVIVHICANVYELYPNRFIGTFMISMRKNMLVC